MNEMRTDQLMSCRAIRLPRLWMVCCAGWLGRSLPAWRKIASGFGAMVATGSGVGCGLCDII